MKQSCALFVFLALVVGSVAASSASADSAARAWVSAHQQPASSDEADLDALKNENPEAFAIVKALLTKRSLGLLNPKHPTASFAPGADASSDDDAKPSGAAAFAKLVSPGELKQAQPSADEVAEETTPVYSDVPKTASHDWLNWKPAASAAESDDAMVQNVLGAVAQLKGGNSETKSLISKARTQSSSVSGGSALENDESMFDTQTDAQQQDPKPAVVSADAESADLPQQQSPSLAKPPVMSAVAQSTAAQSSAGVGEQNSYLKDVDFSAELKADSSKSSDVATDSSALASFSWGADSSTKKQQKVTANQETPKKQNALSAWLR